MHAQALHILGPGTQISEAIDLLRSGSASQSIKRRWWRYMLETWNLSGITDWSTEREQLAEEMAPWADACEKHRAFACANPLRSRTA